MFPVIFSIGPFTLYSFGLFLFAAFFLGLFIVWKRGRELHFDEEALFDAFFAILLWMLIGARVGYIASHIGDFGYNVLDWLNLVGKPGFWFFGGMIGAAFGMVQQAKKRKWNVYELGDVLATAMALAHIVMAIGAFFNGSGYGNPTQSFLGVTFLGLYDRRHPVQLYEAALYVGVFWFLWWAEGAYRTFSWYKGGRSQANSGFILGSFLIAHGLIGLVLCLLRPPFALVLGVRLEVLAYTFWLLVGGWVLLYRSGLKWAQVKAWFQPVPIPGVTGVKKRSMGNGKMVNLGEDIVD